MPPLFKRKEVATSELVPTQVAELAHEAAQATHATHAPEFLAQYSPWLQGSAEKWASIIDKVGKWRTEEIVEGLSVGVANNHRGMNIASTPEDDLEVAQNMANDLSAMWLLAARYEATLPVPRLRDAVKIGMSWGVYIKGMPSQAVKHAVSNLDPTKRMLIGKAFAECSNTVRDADEYARNVLTSIGAEVLPDKDALKSFRDTLAKNPSELTADQAELRRIIAVDWFHYDPKQSLIKQRLQQLREQPAEFIMPFVDKVVHEPQNREEETVRRMGRFLTLATHGIEPTGEQIEASLFGSYAAWENDDLIRNTFSHFVSDEVAKIEHLFSEIAGKPDLKDIRMHRSADTIITLFATIDQRTTTTRAERRAVKKRTGKALYHDSSELPNAADINRQLIEAAPQADRQLLQVRRRLNGEATTEPCDIDTLVDRYISASFPGRSQDATLREDMKNMIEYLRTTPNATIAGLKKLIGVKTLTIDRKVQPLYRFAPDQTAGIRISNGNRYLRAVCSYRNGSLYMLDILSHADFDKKYSRS